MWYKRDESQRRFSIFFQSVTLAGAFGGLLASGIQNMDGIRGYSGWRWIFILEGLLTMVLSGVSFFLIADFPEDAAWLSEDERSFMIRRLVVPGEIQETPKRSSSRELVAYFTDYKSYLGALMYFGESDGASMRTSIFAMLI